MNQMQTEQNCPPCPRCKGESKLTDIHKNYKMQATGNAAIYCECISGKGCNLSSPLFFTGADARMWWTKPWPTPLVVDGTVEERAMTFAVDEFQCHRAFDVTVLQAVKMMAAFHLAESAGADHQWCARQCHICESAGEFGMLRELVEAVENGTHTDIAITVAKARDVLGQSA